MVQGVGRRSAIDLSRSSRRQLVDRHVLGEFRGRSYRELVARWRRPIGGDVTNVNIGLTRMGRLTDLLTNLAAEI